MRSEARTKSLAYNVFVQCQDISSDDIQTKAMCIVSEPQIGMPNDLAIFVFDHASQPWTFDTTLKTINLFIDTQTSSNHPRGRWSRRPCPH